MQIKKTLQILYECGFKIAPSHSCEDILRIAVEEDLFDEGDFFEEYSDKDALEQTFRLLAEDGGDYTSSYCENLLYSEFETYDGYETYMYILERMVEMTRGSLKLENLKTWQSEAKSGEEGEAERVWISFEFRDKKYEFSYEFKKFFDDVDIFTPIITLLEIADPTKIFAYQNFGEMLAIICISKEDLKKLNKSFRGVSLKPLSQKFENI